MSAKNKGNPIVGIIVGLVFIVASLQFFIMPAFRATTNGEKTTGIVTEVKTNKSSKGRISYTPTIEFTAETGEKISFTSSTSSSSSRTKGQQVPVVYNKDNPHEAVIDDLYGTWLFPGFFLVSGLAILAFSTMAYLKKRTEKNNEMTGIFNPSQNMPGPNQNPTQPPPPIIPR